MFGFLLSKKQQEVRRMFRTRMNHNYFQQFRFGQRVNPRSGFCEVVWVVPFRGLTRQPEASEAFPVVTKDYASEGLSILHTQPLEDKQVLLALPGELGPEYVLCTREHTTALGYGFYQIGLHPDEIVKVSPAFEHELQARLEEFTAEPVAV
jgi:hypothetical protein